ncbi:hypothetical protein [Niabella aquatica]
MNNNSLKLLFLTGSPVVLFATARHQLPDWFLGPFKSPANVNHILFPGPQSVFLDPVSQKKLAWGGRRYV